ncbi:unnamed protein product [Effrenium voratum]|uniref:Uncharacterized protein n=1 Tax=Effrenium voratum TaxID=2562239 RepID=A0AA36MN24_9DINO|nr:unnamed protein product [Effrenium voratum]
MIFGDEVKSHWATFLVLFFAHGMKNLVNQVEIAFARSLVACEEPLADAYTGSQWCGNRLEVITAGYQISQRGQAQESFAMLLAITMVAILGSVFGRKAVLLVGLCGTTLSVALFILACALPSWARLLFVAGQGLQGLLPIDHISGLIILDISVSGGGVAAYQAKSILDTVGNLLWGPILGNVVQYLELVNYTTVWLIIFAVNASVLGLAAFVMSESMDTKKKKPEEEEEEKTGSAVSRVVNEVMSYRDVYNNPLSWRFLLMVCIEPCWLHILGMIPVQLMAYHSWSQSGVTMLILIQPLFLVFFPLVPALCLRVGYSTMMTVSLAYLYSVLIAANLSIALSDWVPVFFLGAFTLIGGFMPLKEYVDSRFSTPEEILRFKSVQWVIGYVLGMGIGPVYASLFDARSQTYLARSVPNILACSLMVIQLLHVRFVMYPFMQKTLHLMDEGEAKLNKLFQLVKKGDAPLDKEVWQAAGLEKALGKSLEEAQGPFLALDGFREFVKRESGGTNAEAKAFCEKLDSAWLGGAKSRAKAGDMWLALDDENQALTDRLKDAEKAEEEALTKAPPPKAEQSTPVDNSFFLQMERGKEETILRLTNENRKLLEQAKRMSEGYRQMEEALVQTRKEIKRVSQVKEPNPPRKPAGSPELDEEERIYRKLQDESMGDLIMQKLQEKQAEQKQKIQAALQASLSEEIGRIESWGSDVKGVLLAVDGLEAQLKHQLKEPKASKKAKASDAKANEGKTFNTDITVVSAEMLDKFDSMKGLLEVVEKESVPLAPSENRFLANVPNNESGGHWGQFLAREEQLSLEQTVQAAAP